MKELAVILMAGDPFKAMFIILKTID